jgi:beta-fructofuranosidase
MLDKKLDPEQAKKCQESKWYPKYHVAPPVGWLNDPNGFSYYKGQYHIFYQYHPYSVNWGPMHWGHSTSTDLCHWEHQPIAITPGAFSEGHEWYDWDGCFSGCGYEFEGKLWLMYTSQKFNGAGGVNSSANPSGYNPSGSAGGGNVTERQCFAYSEDGINFTKYEKNPVIDIPNGHPIIANIDFRDPKIWEHNGKFYCVIGNRIHDRSRTQIVLFESDNFFDWTFKSVVAISNPDYSEGTMWECPGFAHFGDKYVMIISPQHVPYKGYMFHNIHQAGYMIGNLDYDQGVFYRGDFFTFDHGFDFYATTMMKNPEGRYFIIAWLAAWQSPFPEQADGWATMLTIPRELVYKDGRVYTIPPKELECMRGEGVHYTDLALKEKTQLDGVKGTCGELLFDVDVKESGNFDFELFSSDKEKTWVRYYYEDGKPVLELNRDQTIEGGKGIRKVILQPFGDILKFRIFLDKSAIEIFINDGAEVMTTRVYPQKESDNIVFIPLEGKPLVIKSLDFYEF